MLEILTILTLALSDPAGAERKREDIKEKTEMIKDFGIKGYVHQSKELPHSEAAHGNWYVRCRTTAISSPA